MPTSITTSRDASHSYYALSVGFELSPGKTDLGAVYAVSAETGATTWLYEQRASTTSVVATGGGLLFLGDTGGGFLALDQSHRRPMACITSGIRQTRVAGAGRDKPTAEVRPRAGKRPPLVDTP